MRLGNADGGAEVGGLDEHREGQFRGRSRRRSAWPRVSDHVFDNRQHPFPADTFHHLLVHGDGRRHDARADVGQVGEFEQALHGAVLAEGAVQDGEDHVDVRLGARFGQDRLGAPLALLVDEVLDGLVPGGIEAGEDGVGRTHGDFVLAGAAAVDYGYSYFHKMRFPSPDMISSTAKSAVRLTSSMTGFTSTTSIETICRESQIISRAKCASR